jgi:hypothetical protein
MEKKSSLIQNQILSYLSKIIGFFGQARSETTGFGPDAYPATSGFWADPAQSGKKYRVT